MRSNQGEYLQFLQECSQSLFDLLCLFVYLSCALLTVWALLVHILKGMQLFEGLESQIEHEEVTIATISRLEFIYRVLIEVLTT